MDQLYNPYVIVPVVAVAVTQILKFAYLSIKKSKSFRHLLDRGGFPSTINAMVFALATAALTIGGYQSPAFGLTLIPALAIFFIVLNQYETERKFQNLSLKKADEEVQISKYDRPIIRASVGACIGFFVALVLTASYWFENVEFIFKAPQNPEVEGGWYVIIFSVVVLFSELLAGIIRHSKLRRLPTSRKIKRALRLTLTLPAVVGVLFAIGVQQAIIFIDIRLWVILIGLSFIPLNYWAYRSTYKRSRKHLEEEAQHFKKAQKKPKKKNSSAKRKKASKR